MTTMIKTYYWYHDPDESIPIMVKLKQVGMPYTELIQEKNTKISRNHVFKDTLI